jgi:hypothetical protein
MSASYVIADEELAVLRVSAKRLFTEMRMNGDEMRNMAQALSRVVCLCEQMEFDAERSVLRDPR